MRPTSAQRQAARRAELEREATARRLGEAEHIDAKFARRFGEPYTFKLECRHAIESWDTIGTGLAVWCNRCRARRHRR